MEKPLFHIRSEEIIQKIVFVVIPSDSRHADGACPEYRRRRRCARERSARGKAGREDKTRGERTHTAPARIINTVAVAEQSGALNGASLKRTSSSDKQAERSGARRCARSARSAKKAGASPAFPQLVVEK